MNRDDYIDTTSKTEEDHDSTHLAQEGVEARSESGAESVPATLTGELRIDAVVASVVAGLSPQVETPPPPAVPEDAHGVPEDAQIEADEGLRPGLSTPLPDWTDPPTGQVPSILLEHPSMSEGVQPKGPIWREGGDDWDEELDFSFLMDDQDEDEVARMAGRRTPTENPFEFSFEQLKDDLGEPTDEPEEPNIDLSVATSDTRIELGPSVRPFRSRSHARSSRRSRPKNVVVATATGVLIAAVAVGCLLAGPLACLVLVAVGATVAGGELFFTLFRAGYRPATLVGLLGIPCLIVGAYLKGTASFPVVFGLTLFVTLIWYLSGRGGKVALSSLGATVLTISWVGVLGSYAALLLQPSRFPFRHGVAFFAAALILCVAHDVGSYGIGARFGRHLLAPRISPNKTIEGLLGGTALTLAVAAACITRLHPFSISTALGLGAIVCVAAPLGDLAESFLKRELKVKDMGNLLPEHGGLFDRIDAMLFVLPATFYLVQLAHLS